MEVLFRNGDRSNIKISKTLTYKALIIWHNYKKKDRKNSKAFKKRMESAPNKSSSFWRNGVLNRDIFYWSNITKRYILAWATCKWNF
jgi:hypothetical protein